MTLLQAMILGIVEGLTEFVPVSSTGHLILAGSWMGIASNPDLKAGLDAFDIVIQAGAWLACVIYYLPLLRARVADLGGSNGPDRARAWRLFVGLAIAFVPAAVVGLLFHHEIKQLLFGPWPVALALAIGGVIMIGVDIWHARRHTDRPLEEIGPRSALAIGVAQCASLIPGTSRSMSTIVGAQLGGFSTRAAADFSFLLAIPILGAATVFEAVKTWHVLIAQIGPAQIVVGLVTAFFFGWLAIAGFLKLVASWGMVPFGLYRIALAVVVWLTLVR